MLWSRNRKIQPFRVGSNDGSGKNGKAITELVMQLMVSGDNIDFAVEPSKPQTQYKTNVGITQDFS